jgi:hypothetical protein
VEYFDLVEIVSALVFSYPLVNLSNFVKHLQLLQKIVAFRFFMPVQYKHENAEPLKDTEWTQIVLAVLRLRQILEYVKIEVEGLISQTLQHRTFDLILSDGCLLKFHRAVRSLETYDLRLVGSFQSGHRFQGWLFAFR